MRAADGADTIRVMNKLHPYATLLAMTLAVVATAPACAQEDAAEANAEADNETPLVAETWDEKASYAIGLNIGGNLEPGDLELDVDLLLRGFRDGLENTEALPSGELDAVLSELGARMQAHTDRAQKAALLENTARGAAFLSMKAREDGVVKTATGLLYREIRAGDGDSPTVNQVVTVHYRGTLIDGTRFDGTYERDQPATFAVAGVIPGWSEALQLMKPGAKWELFIPAELAYGPNGDPPVIPPGAALVFEIELLEVQ